MPYQLATVGEKFAPQTAKNSTSSFEKKKKSLASFRS